MVAGENEPPDKLPDKLYNCCGKKCTTLICIICEKIFHPSCIKKQKDEVKYLSKSVIICSDHSHGNLTSKLEEKDLSNSVKYLIAQIKLRSTEDVRKELLHDVTNRTVDLHNQSMFNNEAEFELLKTENQLQKELIKELQEKNQLLRERFDKRQGNNNEKTYAEAVFYPKIEKKRVPKIIVKRNNNESAININIKQSIIDCIIKDKSIQTKHIRQNKNDDVIINCVNIESVKVTEELLKNKLKSTCDIQTEKLNNPKIKIVGIDNYINMDENELESDINDRNFSRYSVKGKILHIYKNKNLSTAFMEVPADIYKFIRENKNKIFVGHQICRVYDLINIKPCISCGRFGHNKNCKNEPACIKCSGKHKSSECKNVNIKCLNCQHSNSKYNTNYSITHVADDATSCEILINKIKKYIDATDYPIAPVLPSRTLQQQQQSGKGNITTTTKTTTESTSEAEAAAAASNQEQQQQQQQQHQQQQSKSKSQKNK